MKTIIQRYLGAHFILPFIVSCLFFVFFLLTFQLLRITKLVVNKGVPFQSVLILLGHISTSFLPMAIPLSVLFASIYALNKLSADSEFLSMRSFGFSKLKLFAPFLAISFFISLCIFALNQSIIPHSQKEFRKIIHFLTSKGVLADIKAGQFFTEIPNITLFAEQVEENGTVLFNTFIHIQEKDQTENKVIFAKKGILKKINEGPWGKSSLRLELIDGNIIKNIKNASSTEELNNDLDKILFHTYEFPINTLEFKSGLATKDSMKSTRELYQILKTASKPNDHAGNRIDPKDLIKIGLEFWSRINTPLLCLVFTLLGFSLGVQKTRGKNQNSATICFVTLVIYYAIFFTGISLARSGKIPPHLAIFFPTFMTFLLGCRLFSKLEWMA